MSYRTVFDVASAGYNWWRGGGVGLVLIVIGLVLVALREHFPKWFWPERLQRFGTPFAVTLLVGAVIWTLLAASMIYVQRKDLADASAHGDLRVVEGPVTDFQPMPAAGHSMEKFCVRTQCFEYSDYFVTGGFNNTSSHGGPIKEGLPVRVTYVGNTIVKLEVGQ